VQQQDYSGPASAVGFEMMTTKKYFHSIDISPSSRQSQKMEFDKNVKKVTRDLRQYQQEVVIVPH
jgi:hypothetical protein